ncbi:MAG: PAS domain-containing protein [Magnetococcales bacterium]|nr:PAS domain-containing protein [Magnetococcales bacterium]
MPYFSASNLFDHMTTGLIAVDLEGRVKRVNSAAERILGKPRRHLNGRLLKQLLPGHPVAMDLIDRAQTLSMPCSTRSARLSPSPQVSLPVSMTAAPIPDEEGEIVGTILQLEETSAIAQLEEGERLNDTLDSLSSLALSVAHEVKNPLTGIRGAAQLLEMESTSETAAAYTSLIRSEVDRVSRLLDTLLGLADTPHLEEQSMNIHEILDHVLRLSQEALPNPVLDFDPSLPNIRADRDQLIQVFLNLVNNAIEATQDLGYPPIISLSTRIASQIRLEQGRRNLHVVVEVRDNGHGVPSDMKKRIFLPFTSTKNKGVGIGLAICQKIIHDHGGQISLQSKPGETIFRIFLPIPR